jgi:hypothetical protein
MTPLLTKKIDSSSRYTHEYVHGIYFRLIQRPRPNAVELSDFVELFAVIILVRNARIGARFRKDTGQRLSMYFVVLWIIFQKITATFWSKNR